MGCFLACFGSSKNKRCRKPAFVSSSSSTPCPKSESYYKPVMQNLAPKQAKLDEAIIVVTQSPAKQEEQLSAKKVTFVSNVRIHDRISDSVGKTAEISPGKKQSEDEKVLVNGISMVEQDVLPPASENGSAMSSLGSYPLNHRYHNCTESDNEDELECEEEIDVDDYDEEKDATESADDVHDTSNMEEDSPINYQKQTPGSFSSMESRTKSSSPFSAMKNLDSMLVEKLTQLTQLKSVNPKNEQEQAVDTSLSSWLVSSQKTPARKAAAAQSSASSHGSNTVRNFSDRPILGVLTMEHLKQIEASESPRKSPNRSTEDRPIIGSVGSHWSEETPSVQSAPESTFKGIPNTTSKYREDKMVKWHSTPFETRLEQALKKGASGVPF